MDSKDISQLIDQLQAGTISPEDKLVLEAYLDKHPDSVSEDGYDHLAEKALYEHSLIDRRAVFEQMMVDAKPANQFKLWWGVGGFIVVVVAGLIYLSIKDKPVYQTVAIQAADAEVVIHEEEIQRESARTEMVSTSHEAINKPITAGVSVMGKDAIVSDEVSQTEIVTNTSGLSANAENVQIDEPNPTLTDILDEPFIEPEQPFSCPDYASSVTTTVTPSEAGQDNGSIGIDTDNASLMFGLEHGDYSGILMFEHLEPRKYSLYIIDDNACESVIENITVAQTYCVKDYSKDISSFNTEWMIPVDASQLQRIQIFNSMKQSVFELSSLSEREFVWDGNDQSGTQLAEGLYKVVVQYSTETCIFTVSILE